jgi:4-amino-4-deoxy-L-arabinose transferase-like glycosyltransferase
MPLHPALRRVLWGVYALALIAYVVGGIALVPYHGDESTRIHMSHDFQYLFVEHDLSKLLHSENPPDPPTQATRQLDLPLAHYLISLSWRAAGYSDADLPTYWAWGGSWDWNAQRGAIPSEGVLIASRWLPALMGALGVIAVGILAQQTGRPAAAILATALLASEPVYLLSVRRAQTEGPLLGFSGLTLVLTATCLIRRASDRPPSRWGQLGWWVGIGLLTGCTVASKMPGGMTALAVALALIVNQDWRTNWQAALARSVTEVAVVAATALAVVFALSPYYWRDPLARLEDAIRTRQQITADQAQVHGQLESVGERVRGLTEQVFWGAPIYYEDAEWQSWVGDQIAQYEASPLSGWHRPAWARAGLIAAFAAGLAWLVIYKPAEQAQRAVQGLVLIWLGVTVIGSLISVPFGWQRHYLPLWPVVALIEGTGLAVAAEGVRWLRGQIKMRQGRPV